MEWVLGFNEWCEKNKQEFINKHQSKNDGDSQEKHYDTTINNKISE